MSCALRSFSRCASRSPAAACSRRPTQRTLHAAGPGPVARSAAQELVAVKHEEIKGFMPAMTMPYEVRDAKALDGLAPGDLINATLVVVLERRVSDRHQEGRHGAAREAAGRGADAVRLVRLRAAEAGRGRARRRVRRSGRQEAHLQRLQGHRRSSMTFIYTQLPAADVLSADGSAFRGAAEDR